VSGAVPESMPATAEEKRSSDPGAGILALALAIGIVVRIWLATLGHNFDLESWLIAGRALHAGKNVYVETFRLPYAPLWAIVSSLALHVQEWLGWNGMVSFHALIASVLTASDVAIALVLARLWHRTAAIVFILCPVSCLITGYHSQIDTLAILFALLSWCLLARSEDDAPWRVPAAGLLLGLSLATKHLALFFPVWVLFWRRHPLRVRIAYGAIAGAVFVASFVPFSLTPEGRAAVWKHVFLYRGLLWYGNALLPRLVPVPRLWEPIFVAAMTVTGLAVARRAPHDLLPLYLVALVLFTPTIADHYLAIPLVAAAIHWRRWTVWPYLAVASVLLLVSPHNVGFLPAMRSVSLWFITRGFILWPGERSTLWPQTCLAFFFASWWIVAARRDVHGDEDGGDRSKQSAPGSSGSRTGRSNSGSALRMNWAVYDRAMG